MPVRPRPSTTTGRVLWYPTVKPNYGLNGAPSLCCPCIGVFEVVTTRRLHTYFLYQRQRLGAPFSKTVSWLEWPRDATALDPVVVDRVSQFGQV